MPDYVYSCGRHQQTERHGMMDDPAIRCSRCGAKMHRVPQAVAVVWNGNPPSVGTHPLVEKLNDTYDQRRYEFAAKKEAHVNRTESDS